MPISIINFAASAADPQVNSDWNATSGVAVILNKPNLPATFVSSVNGLTGAVVLPAAPVTSVNGLTGAVTVSTNVASKTVSTTTYTTVASDAGVELIFTNSGGCTVTLSDVPTQSTVYVRNGSTGTITFNSGNRTRQQQFGLFSLVGQYAVGAIRFDGTTAILFGSLS